MDTTTLNIENFPEIVLEEILSKLKYHEVAVLRGVNKRFNSIGIRILNKGYKATKLQHTKLYEAIKASSSQNHSKYTKSHPLMYHVLIRHYDVLSTIGRNLIILDDTFSKYINLNLCCFIPGQVIDNMMSIFQTIQEDWDSKRDVYRCECSNAYKALHKSIDTSIKAIQYFNERIAPNLLIDN